MAEKQIIDQVLEIAKMMYDRKMVTTYEGNVSIRFDDKIYITPTTQCKGTLTADMIVILDMDGNKISSTLEASSEYKMHLEFYRLRPDITCVVHTHAPYATAYACARKPIQSTSYFEPILMFDKIPVCDYGITGSKAIFKGIAKYAQDCEALLLANHGLVTYHEDPYEAFYYNEAAESMAKVLFLTNLLGGEHPLSQKDLKELYDMRKQDFGRDELIL